MGFQKFRSQNVFQAILSNFDFCPPPVPHSIRLGSLQICVTNISFKLLVLLDTLELATGATGLYSQGATAVVHGCSIRALGPTIGKFTLSAGEVAHCVHQALPRQCRN